MRILRAKDSHVCAEAQKCQRSALTDRTMFRRLMSAFPQPRVAPLPAQKSLVCILTWAFIFFCLQILHPSLKYCFIFPMCHLHLQIPSVSSPGWEALFGSCSKDWSTLISQRRLLSKLLAYTTACFRMLSGKYSVKAQSMAPLRGFSLFKIFI